jgi:hypothetical protein
MIHSLLLSQKTNQKQSLLVRDLTPQMRQLLQNARVELSGYLKLGLMPGRPKGDIMVHRACDTRDRFLSRSL